MTGILVSLLGNIATKLIGGHLVKQHAAGDLATPQLASGLIVHYGGLILFGMCLVDQDIRAATENLAVTIGEKTGLQIWSAVKGIFGIGG